MNFQSPFATLRNPLLIAGAIAATVISVLAWFLWDLQVARYFFRLQHPGVPEWAGYFSDLGTVIRPEIALLVWFGLRKRKPRWATAALFFLVAVAAAGLFNVSLKILLGRCRPEMLFESGMSGFYWLELEAKYWSMPSGHTAASMAAMVTLTLLFPRVGPLFLLHATLVGVSRVVLMEHYVSDVIMGGVVGGGVALAVFDGYFRQRLILVNWWKGGRRGIFEQPDFTPPKTPGEADRTAREENPVQSEKAGA